MNKNTKDTLMKLFTSSHGTGLTEESIENFLTELNRPDKDFKFLYENGMKQIIETQFKSPAFQKDLLNQIRTIPYTGDIEEEKKEVQNILDIIANDESLSAEKKEFLKIVIESTVQTYLNLMEVERERIQVKIVLCNEDAILPKYAHLTDAGADVYSCEDVTLKPHETKIIKTGIKIAIPVGYEIQIRPRSGLSAKTNLRIANAPGTIDSEYRGEVGIIMTNIGNLSETISKGDRIAQMVIAPTPMISWEVVESLDTTERNEGGFGSTDNG